MTEQETEKRTLVELLNVGGEIRTVNGEKISAKPIEDPFTFIFCSTENLYLRDGELGENLLEIAVKPKYRANAYTHGKIDYKGKDERSWGDGVTRHFWTTAVQFYKLE